MKMTPPTFMNMIASLVCRSVAPPVSRERVGGVSLLQKQQEIGECCGQFPAWKGRKGIEPCPLVCPESANQQEGVTHSTAESNTGAAETTKRPAGTFSLYSSGRLFLISSSYDPLIDLCIFEALGKGSGVMSTVSCRRSCGDPIP